MTGFKAVRNKNRDAVKVVENMTTAKVTPKRLQMNIHPDMHTALQELCFNRTNDQGERLQMSEKVLELVYDWMQSEGVECNRQWLTPPKMWSE